MPISTAPDLQQLASAVAESRPLLARVDAARSRMVSAEGGDVGAHGSQRLVARHVANYLAAVDLAGRSPAEGTVVDVGSGVGALGAWAAERLQAPLLLVDTNPETLAVAARAFPHARTERSVDRVPPRSARLITAMEVLEHIRPSEQPGFVRELVELLAPGGLLVLSTPDERRYLGGWSGYAPHVGTVSYRELAELLRRNTAWPVDVWRLDGPPFELSRVRAVAEPVLNRLWGGFDRCLPALSGRAAAAAAAAGRRIAGRRPRGRDDEPAGTVSATAAPDGSGTGLLGVVARPRE